MQDARQQQEDKEQKPEAKTKQEPVLSRFPIPHKQRQHEEGHARQQHEISHLAGHTETEKERGAPLVLLHIREQQEPKQSAVDRQHIKLNEDDGNPEAKRIKDREIVDFPCPLFFE